MIRSRQTDYFLQLRNSGEPLAIIEELDLPYGKKETSWFWKFLDISTIAFVLVLLYLLYIYSPILENIRNSRELLAEQSCYMNTPAKWVESCTEAKRIVEMTYAEHISDHIRDNINTLLSRLLGEGIVSVLFFMTVIVVTILSYTFLCAVKTYTKMELTRTVIMYASRSIRRR